MPSRRLPEVNAQPLWGRKTDVYLLQAHTLSLGMSRKGQQDSC